MASNMFIRSGTVEESVRDCASVKLGTMLLGVPLDIARDHFERRSLSRRDVGVSLNGVGVTAVVARYGSFSTNASLLGRALDEIAIR